MTWKDIKALADALMGPEGHQCALTDYAKAILISEYAAGAATDHLIAEDGNCKVCHEYYPCHEAKNVLTYLMLAKTTRRQRIQKFKVGDRVKIVNIIDDVVSREMLGWEGVVDEIEENGNTVTYCVEDMYLDEQMLEKVDYESEYFPVAV